MQIRKINIAFFLLVAVFLIGIRVEARDAPQLPSDIKFNFADVLRTPCNEAILNFKNVSQDYFERLEPNLYCKQFVWIGEWESIVYRAITMVHRMLTSEDFAFSGSALADLRGLYEALYSYWQIYLSGAAQPPWARAIPNYRELASRCSGEDKTALINLQKARFFEAVNVCKQCGSWKPELDRFLSMRNYFEETTAYPNFDFACGSLRI